MSSRYTRVLASKHLRVRFVNDYTRVLSVLKVAYGVYVIKRFSTIQT